VIKIVDDITYDSDEDFELAVVPVSVDCCLIKIVTLYSKWGQHYLHTLDRETEAETIELVTVDEAKTWLMAHPNKEEATHAIRQIDNYIAVGKSCKAKGLVEFGKAWHEMHEDLGID